MTAGAPGEKESKDMEAMTMLEKISTAVEKVLEDVRPARTQTMGPEALVAYAMDQIQKAAAEPADKALRRLTALGKAVEVGKQAFVNAASEQAEIAVFEEETTARAEASDKELSPVAAQAALGSSAVAAKAGDFGKALESLTADLEALGGQPATETVGKADGTEWPLDMNSRAFREGVRKAEDEPTWGFDPRE